MDDVKSMLGNCRDAPRDVKKKTCRMPEKKIKVIQNLIIPKNHYATRFAVEFKSVGDFSCLYGQFHRAVMCILVGCRFYLYISVFGPK